MFEYVPALHGEEPDKDFVDFKKCISSVVAIQDNLYCNAKSFVKAHANSDDDTRERIFNIIWDELQGRVQVDTDEWEDDLDESTVSERIRSALVSDQKKSDEAKVILALADDTFSVFEHTWRLLWIVAEDEKLHYVPKLWSRWKSRLAVKLNREIGAHSIESEMVGPAHNNSMESEMVGPAHNDSMERFQTGTTSRTGDDGYKPVLAGTEDWSPDVMLGWKGLMEDEIPDRSTVPNGIGLGNNSETVRVPRLRRDIPEPSLPQSLCVLRELDPDLYEALECLQERVITTFDPFRKLASSYTFSAEEDELLYEGFAFEAKNARPQRNWWEEGEDDEEIAEDRTVVEDDMDALFEPIEDISRPMDWEGSSKQLVSDTRRDIAALDWWQGNLEPTSKLMIPGKHIRRRAQKIFYRVVNRWARDAWRKGPGAFELPLVLFEHLPILENASWMRSEFQKLLNGEEEVRSPHPYGEWGIAEKELQQCQKEAQDLETERIEAEEAAAAGVVTDEEGEDEKSPTTRKLVAAELKPEDYNASNMNFNADKHLKNVVVSSRYSKVSGKSGQGNNKQKDALRKTPKQEQGVKVDVKSIKKFMLQRMTTYYKKDDEYIAPKVGRIPVTTSSVATNTRIHRLELRGPLWKLKYLLSSTCMYDVSYLLEEYFDFDFDDMEIAGNGDIMRLRMAEVLKQEELDKRRSGGTEEKAEEEDDIGQDLQDADQIESQQGSRPCSPYSPNGSSLPGIPEENEQGKHDVIMRLSNEEIGVCDMDSDFMSPTSRARQASTSRSPSQATSRSPSQAISRSPSQATSRSPRQASREPTKRRKGSEKAPQRKMVSPQPAQPDSMVIPIGQPKEFDVTSPDCTSPSASSPKDGDMSPTSSGEMMVEELTTIRPKWQPYTFDASHSVFPVFTPTASRWKTALLNYDGMHAFGEHADLVPHVVVVEPFQYAEYARHFPEHVFLVLDQDGKGVGYSRYMIQNFATHSRLHLSKKWLEGWRNEGTSPSITSKRKKEGTWSPAKREKEDEASEEILSENNAVPEDHREVLWRSSMIWVLDDMVCRFYKCDRNPKAKWRGRQVTTFRDALLHVQKHPSIGKVGVAGYLRENGMALRSNMRFREWNVNAFKVYKAVALNIDVLQQESVTYIPYMRMFEDLSFLFRLTCAKVATLKCQSHFYVALTAGAGGCEAARKAEKVKESGQAPKIMSRDRIVPNEHFRSLSHDDQDVVCSILHWVMNQENNFMNKLADEQLIAHIKQQMEQRKIELAYNSGGIHQ